MIRRAECRASMPVAPVPGTHDERVQCRWPRSHLRCRWREPG